MESTVEKRKRIVNEEITMTKRTYQTRIGRAYNRGRIQALIMIGKTVPEIAKLLDLNESTVRSLKEGKV